MLVSYFESIKHVGHLYPVALLRIYMGYTFLNTALSRLDSKFLVETRLGSMIMDHLPQSQLPEWYVNFLRYIVVDQGQFLAYFVMYCEFIIGISFLLGFLVRPAAALGILLMVNLIYATGEANTAVQQVYLVLFIMLFWVGAGRCLGVDYFFYKRQRGLWW